MPGGYVVCGKKAWIKLGGVSDLMTLLVNTGTAPDGKKLTSRLVLEFAQSPWQFREVDTVGIDRISFAELAFQDVFVPAENMLGTPGEGAEQFNRGIEASRAFVGIQAVGLARRALDLAIAYTQQRPAFGRKLAGFQAIQVAIADAATKLEAARTLCLSALAKLDCGQRDPKAVAMAKLFATETAVEVCHAAMDSMGAAGLSRDAGRGALLARLPHADGDRRRQRHPAPDHRARNFRHQRLCLTQTFPLVHARNPPSAQRWRSSAPPNRAKSSVAGSCIS